MKIFKLMTQVIINPLKMIKCFKRDIKVFNHYLTNNIFQINYPNKKWIHLINQTNNNINHLHTIMNQWAMQA